MKHLKHLLTAALVMFVALAVATPAWAASITITRDETFDGSAGRTYTAYKVFDADTSLVGSNTQDEKQPVYTADGPIAYSMEKDSPWLSVLWDTENDQPATGQTWFNITLAADESKYVVTPVDGLDDSDAADIATFLKNNKPSGAASITVTPGTAAEVGAGYYYLEASDGATNATLVTTDVEIVEKNTYITTTKTTSETSYSIGDPISYTATVVVPADAKLTDPIILHDEMNDVLKFNDDVEGKVDGESFTGFTVTKTGLSDDCTFEISIPVTSDILGKTITFTYSAELTSAAVDPDTGFINKLFGEKNGYKTSSDEPKVYTFDFDFSKEFVGSTDSSLVATFELQDAQGNVINLIAGSGAGKYIVADKDDTGTVTVITSANNAAINVQGLKAGTYSLVEKTTSTGYNKLTDPAVVVITDTSEGETISHTVTIDGEASTEGAPAKIQNNQGTVLPSTGGMGTTIFYIVGGVMVAGAIIALITKKRVNDSEK